MSDIEVTMDCDKCKAYQQGRADGIEEYKQLLHFKYVDNKKISDAIEGLRGEFTNLDLEEIDMIAEQLNKNFTR